MSSLIGNYKLLNPINSGKYGTVYLARNLNSQSENAIKLLPKSRMDMNQSKNKMMIDNEITNMTTVKGHKNIVILEDILEDDDNVYLIEEYCGGDNLSKSIYTGKHSQRSHSHKNPTLAAITDIVNAITHCHQNDIIFADLKPENIVYSKSHHCYKLTDFGSSIKVNPTTKEGVIITSTPSIAPPNDFSPTCPIVTFKFDVWSIGIITRLLYQSNNLQNDAILGFIHSCLQEHPDKRISSEEMQTYWYEIISYEK